MAYNENKVERYLHKKIKALGGTTYKWESPGCSGVPDRIIILQGEVEFVEVKTIVGKLSPMQIRRIDELEKLNQTVSVVYGEAGVDQYIESLKQRRGIA